ncbi:TPA: glycosyltransferase family 4 protein [Photobacterium damselae]
MKKIVHIVNRLEIGGVEVGVLNLLISKSHYDYHVVTIKGVNDEFLSTLSIEQKEKIHVCSNYISAILTIIKLNPDIICSSLWRSHIVRLVVKSIIKRCVNITFIHSTTTAHIIDKVISIIAVKYTDMIFCDSEITQESLIQSGVPIFKTKIIPMNVTFCDIDKQKYDGELKFLYVGRFTKEQKNIKQSVDFINKIKNKLNTEITFHLYGRDDGELKNILDYVGKLQLDRVVLYKGEINPVNVEKVMKKYTFFLQTSLYEGMCITCFQALKSGLIPIINPVGEIRNYTEEYVNALYVDVNNIDDSVFKFIDFYQKNEFSKFKIGKVINENSYPPFNVTFFKTIDDLLK